jgi:CheY-like chemotaxis protein
VLDLNALTVNLEKMLRRLLREDIELRTRFAEQARCVSADPGQIEQVIVNLVVNARDAMPEGGRITIETSNVDLEADHAARHADAPAGHYVLLTVTDTGHGMDDGVKARIFEPFFTTKPVGQGTGLGLSTVYGIVKQSGGHVLVDSEVAQGATFRVYLPAVLGPTAASALSESGKSQPASCTGVILLVEDEPTVRSIARRILERDGYTVVEAGNGVQALEIIAHQQKPVALVLTDLVMPEMGGRELVERVREVSPSSRVLFMSGYTEDAILRQSMIEPGTLFLHKPFTLESLTSKVREALRAA